MLFRNLATVAFIFALDFHAVEQLANIRYGAETLQVCAVEAYPGYLVDKFRAMWRREQLHECGRKPNALLFFVTKQTGELVVFSYNRRINARVR